MIESGVKRHCLTEQCNCKDCGLEANRSQVEIKVLSESRVYKYTVTDIEIVFVRKGKICVYAGGDDPIHAVEGGLFLLPPGWCVQMAGEGYTELLICRVCWETDVYKQIYLTEKTLAKEQKNRGDAQITILAISPLVETFLQGFTTCLNEGVHCRYYLTIKIEELLFLMEYCYTREEIIVLYTAFADADARFKNFVLSSLRKDISSRELFLHSNMSRAAFDARFRKIMGNSPKRYVDQYKAEWIEKDLSHTRRTAKEMAYTYGFTSENVFIRFCVKHLGMPPGRFRKKMDKKREIATNFIELAKSE